MNIANPIFYPEEDPGIILQGPEGELQLTTYDLGEAEGSVWAGWIGYRIDFDLAFVTPTGETVSVEGYNQSKLWIGDQSVRERLEGESP